MSFTTDSAYNLAAQLHAGIFDKSGEIYLGHLRRVAEKVREAGGNDAEIIAAYLHDSIEDTEATLESLEVRGVPWSSLGLIFALTHQEGESNDEYWKRIRNSGASAILIKNCDIHDNLTPARLAKLDPETQKRLRRKYGKALQIINA